MRSLRSEYDYKSKKKFVDLVSTRNPTLTQQKLEKADLDESAFRTTGIAPSQKT